MMTRTLPDGRKPTVAEFEEALQGVLAAGAAAGTPVGMHTFSPQECKDRVAQGFKFMAMSSDVGLLGEAAALAVDSIGLVLPPNKGGVAKY
jgi:2-keto-3-deoxy-L-rhamnonate aldolase RhmA